MGGLLCFSGLSVWCNFVACELSGWVFIVDRLRLAALGWSCLRVSGVVAYDLGCGWFIICHDSWWVVWWEIAARGKRIRVLIMVVFFRLADMFFVVFIEYVAVVLTSYGWFCYDCFVNLG